MTPDRARELLETFEGRRVLLVGDLMMDEWVIGSVKRISPEAPIPVVAMPLGHEARTYKPGGAGNVAAVLLGLGAQVRVLGVVGEDELGEELSRNLADRGADVSGVVRDSSRPTSHKMRILAGRQQLVRVDSESTKPLETGLAQRLREAVQSGLGEADVVLVADYAKGVLSEESLPAEVFAEARKASVPICADPKPSNIDLFTGAWLVSPNEGEALQAAGMVNARVEWNEQGSTRVQDLPPPVARAGWALRERLEAEAVFVTMGEVGIAVFPHDGEAFVAAARRFDTPSGATAVGDGTGCGDAASAASALTLAAGGSFREAAELANAAGGVASRFVGVYSPRPAEILAALDDSPRRKGER